MARRPETHQAGGLRRLRAGRVARPFNFTLKSASATILRAAREADNRIVKFNSSRHHRSADHAVLLEKGQFQPRLSATFAPPADRNRGGFGIFVGPGQTEDQISRSRRAHQHDTDGGPLLASRRPGVVRPKFINNRTTARIAPRLSPDTRGGAGLSVHDVVPQELPGSMAATVATSAARGATCSSAASPPSMACSRTARPRLPRSASSTSSRAMPTARLPRFAAVCGGRYKPAAGKTTTNAMRSP